jgi:hypothetical protein
MLTLRLECRYFVLHHNKLQYYEMIIKKTIPLVRSGSS